MRSKHFSSVPRGLRRTLDRLEARSHKLVFGQFKPRAKARAAGTVELVEELPGRGFKLRAYADNGAMDLTALTRTPQQREALRRELRRMA